MLLIDGFIKIVIDKRINCIYLCRLQVEFCGSGH